MTRMAKAMDSRAYAQVTSYPEHGLRKGVLRRLIQLLKVHRDHFFANKDAALPPLSIIITTLAMQVYEHCVTSYPYDNELDLVCDTIRLMPVFIERAVSQGRVIFIITNETTTGENFAERWNQDARLAPAFYAWQERALADFEAVAQSEGLDQLQKSVGDAIGEAPVRRAADDVIDSFARARSTGLLGVGADFAPAQRGALLSYCRLQRPSAFIMQRRN